MEAVITRWRRDIQALTGASSSSSACVEESIFIQCEPLTQAHSSAVQFEAHVALAAVSDPHRGDTPPTQTQVWEGLADVGYVLG
jgi:hypothetical protein